MKLVVFIKSVPDNTRLSIGSEGPRLSQAVWMLNPYDEYALEAALKLKDTCKAQLIVISCGTQKDGLKKALALGADAVYLLSPASVQPGLPTALYLAAAAQTLAGGASLYLTGQSSLDLGFGITGPAIAEQLDLPWLGHVRAITSDNDGLAWQIIQALPEGQRQISYEGPVVLSCGKGLHELRNPNIKGVMAANRLPILEKQPTDVEFTESTQAVVRTGFVPKKSRPSGRVLQGLTPEAAAQAFSDYLTELGLR